MASHREQRGVLDLDLDRISRELGLGPDELKATLLADGTPAAVATHEEAGAKAVLAGTNGDFIGRGLEAFNAMPAPDLDPDGERVRGEDALEVLHLDPDLGVGRAWEPVRPPRRIDYAGIELDAREVAARPAALRAGSDWAGPRLAVGSRLRRDLFEKSPPVEGFDARTPETSHPEREPLQG